MRFLLGLVLGGAVTFALATVTQEHGIDVPSADDARRIIDGAVARTRAFANAVQERAAAAREGATQTRTDDTLRNVDAIDRPAQSSGLQQEAVGAEDVARVVMPGPDRHGERNERLDTLGPTETASASDALAALEDAYENEPAATAGFDDSAPPTDLTPIWTPFHSERSALGFANRLERETGRDFVVNKEGAGRYQVSFSHRSATDREALLAEIEDLTGYAP